MFEIDIRIAALKGVMLHERDGTPYWQLAKVCTLKGCTTIMDECMCFSTEKAMLDAKPKEFYCSSKCWFAAMPVDKQMEQMETFREAANDACWHLSGDEVRRLPQVEFLEEMYEFINQEFENACCDTMSEVCDADLECPI